MKLFTFIGVLTVLLSTSCSREKFKEYEADKHNSYLTTESKELSFFDQYSGTTIVDMKIDNETVAEPGPLHYSIEKISKLKLPNSLNRIDKNNYQIQFDFSGVLNKPVALSFHYPSISEDTLLSRYKPLFSVYQLQPNTDPKESSNWIKTKGLHDKNAKTITVSTTNLRATYAVLMNEIKRKDNYLLSLSGDSIQLFDNQANYNYADFVSNNKQRLGSYYIENNNELHFYNAQVDLGYAIECIITTTNDIPKQVKTIFLELSLPNQLGNYKTFTTYNNSVTNFEFAENRQEQSTGIISSNILIDGKEHIVKFNFDLTRTR